MSAFSLNLNPQSQSAIDMRKTLSSKSLVGEGPLTFEDVLRDPVNLNYFKKFCVDEMSTENLLFWLEVEEYKMITASEYRAFFARKMFRKYFREASSSAIGISEKLRLAVEENLETPSASIFDEAQEAIAINMKFDSFPRFVQSSFYGQLVDLKFDERKVVGVDDFDIYRFLGAGGFGMVLLVRHRQNDNFYAMKVIDKRILISQNQVHSIFREREVLALVEHPFIVALKYAFQTPDHLCFVLDYIKGGNMYSHLMKGAYPPDQTRMYCAEIVMAMHHLHEMDILYRDLKPDNVLLTADGHVKLADMGAARGITEDGSISSESQEKTAKPQAQDGQRRQRRMTITGTHGYRAPEVYNRDYGKPADWWCVGIMIAEMLTAENPFRGENRRESEYLTKHKELHMPKSVPQDAIDCMMMFLDRDPDKRKGYEQLKEIQSHPFFNGIDWEKLMAFEQPITFQVDMDSEPLQPQRPLTKETNNLDYYCQMVDYMKTSMSMRATWQLKAEDQKQFEGFDYVSPKVFEEEINALQKQTSEF